LIFNCDGETSNQSQKNGAIIWRGDNQVGTVEDDQKSLTDLIATTPWQKEKEKKKKKMMERKKKIGGCNCLGSLLLLLVFSFCSRRVLGGSLCDGSPPLAFCRT